MGSSLDKEIVFYQVFFVCRPIRGVNAMAAGAGPAHAMYFTCLEYGKTLNEKSTLIPASVGDGKLHKIYTCNDTFYIAIHIGNFGMSLQIL